MLKHSLNLVSTFQVAQVTSITNLLNHVARQRVQMKAGQRKSVSLARL